MNTLKHGRTRKAHSKQVEITFHSDDIGRSNAHPAINVKVYSLPHVEASEDAKEQAYHHAEEMFWQNAALIAHKHGYSGVFSEGRSNGWCVPYYQYFDGKLQQWLESPGQGPDKGYPSYPDVTDAKERRRFVNFRADILELLDAAKQFYVSQVTE
jgi:hypothetical protein